MSEKQNIDNVITEKREEATENIDNVIIEKREEATENIDNVITEKREEAVVMSEEEFVEEAKDKFVEEVSGKLEDVVGNLVGDALDKTLIDIDISENISELVGDVVGEMVGDVVGELVEGISKDLIDKVHAEVKERLCDIGVKSSTLSIMIKYTMEAIENTPVKGKTQLDFAVRIIGDLINELENSEEKEFLLKTLNNGGIKDTIELVVDASKGYVNINNVAETATSNCLMPCIEYLLGKCR